MCMHVQLYTVQSKMNVLSDYDSISEIGQMMHIRYSIPPGW